MSELAVIERPQRREIMNVIDPVPTLDTARFEHMQRIANVMARSTMIPETLRTVGPKDHKVDLPVEQVMANCFLVVNQAVRWGMDPFAVVSCCAVVHGRLSYEGKLVAAVLDAKLGLQLHHHFVGDPSSEAYRIYVLDQPFTPEIIAQLKPGVSIPGFRLWDGSVAEWKTTGAGTPWVQKNYKRMLTYRGARDWTRIYEPAIMLGVYTEDELIDLADDARARRSAPVVSLAERLTAATKPTEPQNGFSETHVTKELGGAPAAQANAPEQESSTPADAGAATGTVESAAPLHSSETPQPPEASATKPAPHGAEDPSSAGAGTTLSSETVIGTTVSDEPKQAGGGGTDAVANAAGLPEGWERLYAQKLSEAKAPRYLTGIASKFWNAIGGWERHKTLPHASTAIAIYDAFAEHFGPAGEEARNVILHELGAV